MTLPSHYHDQAQQYLLPICKQVAQQCDTKPFVLGICGAQGSGKTTAAIAMKRLFETEFDLKTLVTSIDDYYLTKQQRAELAQQVHPLLQTRGVPSTHDVALGIKQLKRLRAAQLPVEVPIFDKANDDRSRHIQRVDSPIDVIIFEGWCVGARPYLESFDHPINVLEREHDRNAEWRRHYIEALNGEYQTWFTMIDRLLFLKIPDLESVVRWRQQQERQLSQQTGSAVMSDDQIERFVMHYERITTHLLNTMPSYADWIITLDRSHCMIDKQTNP